MRAADAWCATPILVSDSAALCASVGVFAASRPQDGQEPKAGAGKALTALRYRPECLGHRPNGYLNTAPSQIFAQCHIVGLITWSDDNIFIRLGAHHDHRQLDIK